MTAAAAETRAPAGTAASLALASVTAGYGELKILVDLTLEVAPGETVGIIGRNGMGKTTLISTIAGRTRVHSGEVSLSGRPITGESARLSGGEQQMLSIARALMCDPSLLLMDEPSEGLAPVIVDELYVALRRIVAEQGLTLLLVEQNAHRALSFAARAVGLRNGEIVYDGPSRVLLEDESRLDRIMGVRAE